MTARALFEDALEAARAWHRALPPARAFCDWPTDLAWTGKPPRPLPSARLVASDPGPASPASSALLSALQALVPHVEWRHGYTAQEVGQDFLDRFCWFELAGPHGHFLSHQTRLTVGYWGPRLFYPRHQHAPAELYTVVSGGAVFHADDEADATLGPGDTRLHAPRQPHAMTTIDQPVLSFVFWRGAGLDDPPRMTR